MTPEQAIHTITGGGFAPRVETAEAFAPANVALAKYWGKREEALKLPVTGSLSISLGNFGTRTRLSMAEKDGMTLNGEDVTASKIAARTFAFVELFRGEKGPRLHIETENTVPTGAGVASSASGFAALVKALDKLCGWELPVQKLSLLARLGSGSACRSLEEGFVEWHRGEKADGMDSFAEKLDVTWPGFRVGLLEVAGGPKAIGSTDGMRQTVETSPLYPAWVTTMAEHLPQIREAVLEKDFAVLGPLAQHNALTMHATALAASPAVCYWQAETLVVLQKLWALQAEGWPVFATLDAGPNIKLLFLESEEEAVKEIFPGVQVIRPFP